MKRLLKAPAWAIFLLLIVGISMSNFTIGNDALTTSVIRIIALAIYFIYPFTVATILKDQLPNRIKLNYNFYLLNSFIWFTTYSGIIILSDGQGMTFNGLATIPILYVIFAFIHFLAFPAKTLKSIELKKEAGLGDYMVDSFLLLFLPLGIWILHPRIRQVLEQEEIIEEI